MWKNVNTFVSLVFEIQMQRYFENLWKIINTTLECKQRYRSQFAQVFIKNLGAQLFLDHRRGLGHGDRLTSLDDPLSLHLVGSASKEGVEVVNRINGD